jgi:uncharacterized hydrophobic protein (TIGR00271 family)
VPRLSTDDLVRIREALFFEEPARSSKLSRFWLLLILSSMIASAGVIADSTATVIGAMIVAPLMTPILGLAFAARLGDGANIRRSLLLVVGGAATVVLIGLAFGIAVRWNIVSDNNAQVAARVSPHLVDLIAALATGAVGAVALARSDISDTLPGVAIAISLVPPLAVVGITLSSRAWHDAFGSLTLFVANVAAILVSGSIVLALYRVTRTGAAAIAATTPWRRWRSSIAIGALLVVVAIPLTRTTISYGTTSMHIQQVRAVAEPWAAAAGGHVIDVTYVSGFYDVTVVAPAPGPPTADLKSDLDAAGLSSLPVAVNYVSEQITHLS